MDPLLFASFLAATLLIIAFPGPSCALAASQLVRRGPRATYLCVAGDALGSVVHIIIAVASLQMLIGLADVVLPYLQIAGGLFILYLGLSTLRQGHHESGSEVLNADRSAFLSGFFACVTNPKAIVFFVALFPGFISTDHAILPQTLIYGAVFVTLDGLSILAYAFLTSYLVKTTLGTRISVETLSGWGLIGVALLLIFKGWKAVPAQ
ncbi:MAG: LysE family translocator [Sulfitobacter sp.]